MTTVPNLVQPRQNVDLRGVGKQVARNAGGATVAAFFEANRGAIASVLPVHMGPDRMLKIALRCLRTSPKLMDCTVDSLFGAVVTCAQLGLEPNTPQGHVYLIPFENRKKQTTEVQVIVGYKGLVDLARRSGEIESISARVVCRNDTFEVDYGTDDRIVHKPQIEGERGGVIGFYAVARLKGGGVQFEFMSKREVDAVMRATQSKGNYGPWRDHYEEMGRKTLIRRLSKYLPMSIELANASALDDRAEVGKPQGLASVLEGEFVVEDEDDIIDPETGEVHEDTRPLAHTPDAPPQETQQRQYDDATAAQQAKTNPHQTDQAQYRARGRRSLMPEGA